MNNIWFISDTHFSHSKIIEYESARSHFKSVEEMNEKLIENWNANIKPKDTVYHLGDFVFGRHNLEIAGRLNGSKRLIMGNHDLCPAADYLKYFDKLYGAKFWEDCLLTHIPVHESHARVLLNVHGHLHGNNVKEIIMRDTPCEMVIDDIRYFNASIEKHNLSPVHADIIRDRVKEIGEL